MSDIEIRQGEIITLDVLNGSSTVDLAMEDVAPLTLGIDVKKGMTDYPSLTGKPKINGVTVNGEKIGEDYKLQNKMNELTVQEIEKILYLGGK